MRVFGQPPGAISCRATRSTKRGADRTPLSGDYDVIVCGASFAGLTIARQLAGSGARVSCSTATTSASARPRPAASRQRWLDAMGLWTRSARSSTSSSSTPRTEPRATSCRGASRPSTTGRSARSSSRLRRPIRNREGRRRGDPMHRPSGSACLVLRDECLSSWRRIAARCPRRWSWMPSAGGGCSPATAISRPTRRSRAASRSIRRARRRSGDLDRPPLRARRLRLVVSRRRGERIGVGSFDPRFHVKDTTVLLADDLERDAVRYQGNWIPHKLRRGDRGQASSSWATRRATACR